jgi:hypothetical protein
MRSIVLVLPLALSLAACSREASPPVAREGQTSEAAADAAESAPGITPEIAPGVAFDFRYGFALPEARISAVQEQHAALCGRLGVARCRVTGLDFTKERDGEIAASMTFKLDPALALGFARDATSLVEAAEGKLSTSKVAGEDVGSTIVAGDKTADGLRAELAKAEAELRIPGLSRAARDKLVERGGEVRAQLRNLEQVRDSKVESLATTPVRFDYEVARPAIGVMESLRQGLGAGETSTSALLRMLALALGALGPWALLIGGGWWAVRRWRRRPVAALTGE